MLHSFEVTIISAQQLPRPRDASGLEVLDKGIVDLYVEVTLHVPDWPVLHHVAVGGGAVDDEQREKGKEEATQLQETMIFFFFLVFRFFPSQISDHKEDVVPCCVRSILIGKILKYNLFFIN